MPDIKPSPAYLLIHGFRDLAVAGISPLTGEACAFSQRILCDVSEPGRALLQDFFGVSEFATHPNMNSTVGDAAAIGSVMLPRGIWRDLAAYYAFSSGALAYLEHPDGTLMVLYAQELLDRYTERTDISIVRNPATSSLAPRVGSRNVHMATGRVM